MKKNLSFLLLLLFISTKSKASERDQVVPVMQVYNEDIDDLVNATQPDSDAEYPEEGSQGQGLVPHISLKKETSTQKPSLQRSITTCPQLKRQDTESTTD